MLSKTCFSTNLKYLRKQNNMTLKDISKICGVHLSLVSRWETELREPDGIYYKLIADYFNITVDDLMNVDLKTNQVRKYTPIEARNKIEGIVNNTTINSNEKELIMNTVNYICK